MKSTRILYYHYTSMISRKPFALANWKMAMTVAESLAFLDKFQALAGVLLEEVDVVVCPPYTALWPAAQKLKGSSLQLGAQNLSHFEDASHTGEVSAALLAEAGCRWVMLGHWEVRRSQGETDEITNHKIHLCLDAGLLPILLVGESRFTDAAEQDSLEARLDKLLAGVEAGQIAGMAFIYEPEETIGSEKPASPEQVAKGCRRIRDWIRRQRSQETSEQARIIYGGSVTPEHAASLLSDLDIDGLGAGRKGRDPAAFAEIVRQVWKAKRDKPDLINP